MSSAAAGNPWVSPLTALPAARTDRRDEDQGQLQTPVSGRSTLLRYPAWAGLFAVYFGLGVLSNIFPLIAHDSLRFSKTAIGGLLLVRSFAGAAGFVVLGSFAFRHFRSAPMIAGQVVGVVAFLLLAWAHTAVTVGALLVVAGVVAALGYSNSIFHGVSGSANRAGRMAVHESVLSCGSERIVLAVSIIEPGDEVGDVLRVKAVQQERVLGQSS